MIDLVEIRLAVPGNNELEGLEAAVLINIHDKVGGSKDRSMLSS